MKMSKNYKQYDTRWSGLGYPRKPHFIKACGCGEVAIANCIVRRNKYKDATPKTIQPYCKQFAAPNGDGTYWSAPPTMLKHYGFTEVKEHQNMASLWKELAKYNRVAIYLMSNRSAGNKGVHWTGSKHFIASTGYKYDKKTGKHLVYLKDSNSDAEIKNGWHAYEDVLRNAVFKVWSGKLPEEDIRLINIMNACKKQAEWMQNYKYSWESNPTIAKSKKKGTCVTYVACVLQRLGYLKSGQYIWHDGNGKVTHANSKMSVSYPKGTLKSLKSKLRKGDIVIAGDKKNTEAGSHIFILNGNWTSKGNPYIWDNHSCESIKDGKSGAHTYSGKKKVIAVIRLK